MLPMTEGAPHEYKEQRGTCIACGNSPVRHFEHYVSNTLAVWTAQSQIRNGGVFSRVSKWLERIFDSLEQPFLRLFGAMPFAKFSDDVSKANTYRSQVIWEEAARRGIPMQQLVLFGRTTEVYRAHILGNWFFFQSLPVPARLRSVHAGWLDDKYLLKQALRSANIPSPVSISSKNTKEALAAFELIGGPVVVKPRSGSRARHTTVGISELGDISSAFVTAQQLCRYVVIEQYLVGPVCRATVVGGKLVGFFEGRAPEVVGDGRATIAELIERKNAGRHERVQPIELNEEYRDFLSRKGISEDSVVESGHTVALTHRTGRLFGGTTREILGKEHPKLRAHIERAAAMLGGGVVGLDLIIENAERDPDEQQWGIIEANSLPYIDLHYLPLEGTPSNVAADVWDMWK